MSVLRENISSRGYDNDCGLPSATAQPRPCLSFAVGVLVRGSGWQRLLCCPPQLSDLIPHFGSIRRARHEE
jgi:hypothetical protein